MLKFEINLKKAEVFEVPRYIQVFLKPLLGKRIVISVEKWRKKRSNSQNAYYWAVVVKSIHNAFTEAGNDVSEKEVHAFLKSEVGKLNKILVLPTGEVRELEGTTTDMSTGDFMEYVEKCVFWAMETLALTIPLPNETTNNTLTNTKE